jgi:GDSL-like Lipase/Acylhydrolase
MARFLSVPFLLTAVCAASVFAQAPPAFVGMGDSIGEGVQSADATWQTQPHSYLNLIAQQMGVSFPLPLIVGTPISNIFTVSGRARLNPNLNASNLAVSGATVNSMLTQVAGQPVANEADLVLEPRTGTQMGIAQSLGSPFTICWIGNGDALQSVLAWDQLNSTPPLLTNVSQFGADYYQIMKDLAGLNGKVVVGTVPDIPQIAFVFTQQDLIAFLGTDFGMPEGSYTTLPTMLLIKLGLLDGTAALQTPNSKYVLSSANASLISSTIGQYNQIIRMDAEAAGFAVADINAAFEQLMETPPVFSGVALTRQFNGGLFSLDGVHPSDIGHALAANIFIQAANQQFGTSIPLLTQGPQSQLTQIADADPFIDWDGSLVVRGRPLAGLLETLGPFLGISGNLNNTPGAAPAPAAVSKIDKAAGQRFMQQYLTLKGLPANTAWTAQDAINAMKEVFRALL